MEVGETFFCLHVGVFFYIRRNPEIKLGEKMHRPTKFRVCPECSACDSTLVTEHTIQGSAWALPIFLPWKKKGIQIQSQAGRMGFFFLDESMKR